MRALFQDRLRAMSFRLIFGFHAVLAKLRHDPDAVKEILLDQARFARKEKRVTDILAYAELSGIKTTPLDGRRLDAMLPEARHQGVVARVDGARRAFHLADVLDALDVPPLLLVLDGVTDPRNLGACLRVADGAGAHAVIAPKDRSAGLTETAVKAASGAAESVPYILVTNLSRALRELREREITVLGAAGDAPQSLYEAEFSGATAWVLGAEDHGLRRMSRENCDQLVRIPMRGAVESLNVSVAAGLCLFEARRRYP
ncbi:MAG: 23S rRNA (guanosine(2251)-2'-O)-methyltransferase RlmB [Zoogloeaceae bacterium]|jgi:23S rRNA (guanosine2251-2'-O)-methyltransferase|nr:23S rRNA (guanosine(2251)-2'-O)-methyltransferase RlmB [Zoogloeaceae bacterium]